MNARNFLLMKMGSTYVSLAGAFEKIIFHYINHV